MEVIHELYLKSVGVKSELGNFTGEWIPKETVSRDMGM